MACIYNSSNTKNNAGWKVDRDTFTFYTTKNIKQGEEIRTFYGYFVDDSSRNWNTDLVFFFGVDNFKPTLACPEEGDILKTDNLKSCPCLSAIKFSTPDAYEQKRKDPGYHKLINLIQKYSSLKFERVSAISPFGEEGLIKELANINSSKEIYEILHGYKTSNATKIKFIFSNFVNEERDEVVIDR